MYKNEVKLELSYGQLPALVCKALFKTKLSSKILGYLTQSTLTNRDQIPIRQITCPIVEVEYITMNRAIKTIEWLLDKLELNVEGYDLLSSLEESLSAHRDLTGEMTVTSYGVSMQLFYDRKPLNEPFFWYPMSRTLAFYKPVENIPGYAIIPPRK
ncbi:MAG: hypothetical protein ACKO23_03780 [Gemmataceae bacterium]